MYIELSLQEENFAIVLLENDFIYMYIEFILFDDFFLEDINLSDIFVRKILSYLNNIDSRVQCHS